MRVKLIEHSGNEFVDSLIFPLQIYRGLKNKDIDMKNIGISWTTDFAIANEFAGEDGIVLSAVINKNGISLEDTIERNNEFENMESEIIIKDIKFLKNIHINDI